MAVNPTNTGGASTLVSNYNDEYGLIEKVALQVITNVEAVNPLMALDKGSIDNGTSIEQAVVELVESEAYNKSGANALTPKHKQLIVRYFKDWTRKKFQTTVYDSDIRKVLLRDGNTGSISERLVANLSESDDNERYENIRDLLTWGKTALVTSGVAGKTIIKKFGDTATSYKGLLTAIKDAVKAFGFVKNTYNGLELKTRTPKNRIYIVMPYTIKNAIDVNELAGVFNLSKDEVGARIIETDATDGSVYVVDSYALQLYTRLYELRSQYNADGLFMNYFLHTDRMYALSPAFNAVHIDYNIA